MADQLKSGPDDHDQAQHDISQLPKVAKAADVSREFLASTLSIPALSSFECTKVGTGQMSNCYRISLDGTDKTKGEVETVILKVAAEDPDSRGSGVRMGLYQREVQFYQQISTRIQGHVAKCFYAAIYEDQTFTLLLQDAMGMRTGDDIVGASLAEAKLCLRALGDIHGQTIRMDPGTRFTWLKRDSPLNQAVFEHLFNGFVARYRDSVSVEHLHVCSRLVSCYDAYREQSSQKCVQGMIHGDYRLDNILLNSQSTDMVVVDWQTIAWGALLGDVAYFLGCALPVELRRAHFDELLQTYCSALGKDAGPLTLERCRQDLRLQSFFGVVMAVASSMLVERTERGDKMFLTMLARHCDLVLDLDALSVLPEPAVQSAVLQPKAEDEGLHARGPETLFNESYYFDVVDEKQGIAAYVRLGITPNVPSGGWYLAVISRRGQPMVSIMDYACPIPDETLRVKTAKYEAEHQVIEGLKAFRISLNGRGSKHDDAASIFKSNQNSDNAETQISLDLTFHTDGIPYQYRITTRYEIPCLVDGKLVADGHEYRIKQQVGQRDHSWGVRNWWNMDWLWSALHLEDGRFTISKHDSLL